MVLPRFEAEPERGELCETFPEFRDAQLMRRDRAGCEFLDRVTGVPRDAVADAAEAPAADSDLGLEHLAHSGAEGQIGVADNSLGDAAGTITARPTHSSPQYR